MVEQQISQFDSRAYAKENKNAKLKKITVYLSNTGFFIESLDLQYPEFQFSFEERKNGRNQPPSMTHAINISEQEFLKRVVYQCDQGFVTWIEFAIQNSNNQERLEVVGVNSDPNYQVRKFESSDGCQIMGMKCIRSTFLISVECNEDLLLQYQSLALVGTINTNHARLVNNYHAIKLLQDLIPPLISIDEKSKYKDHYMKLNLELETLFATKINISDDLQDMSGTISAILIKYKELSVSLARELQKDAGKFSLKRYSNESKKLEQYQGQLSAILEKFDKHEQTIKDLRLKDSHKSLKMYLSNTHHIQNIKSAIQSGAGFTGAAEEELIRLQNERVILEQQQLSSSQLLRLQQDDITLLLDLITQSNQQITDLKKKQVAGKSIISGHAVQELADYASQGADVGLNRLQIELQDQLTKLADNFDIRKNIIKDKIQKEVNKIESGKNGSKEATNPLKKMHIIIIADESGSMSGNWISVSETVDNFIAHFATTDDESHLFSAILFDNACRIHAKREKASNVQKLPNLKSGGTSYGPAIELGSTFALTLTPAGYTPLIMFMTDGLPSDGLAQSITALKKCSQKPNFMFFAVGFGRSYKRDILVELSNAGNNNKLGHTIGQKEIKFVYDAIDDEALQFVFNIFQQNFDFAAQENAIGGLQKQLTRETNEYENQSDFFTKLNQRKVQNMQSDISQLAKFKDLSINDREESYVKLLESQISTSMKEKVSCSEKIRTLEASTASLEATQNKLTDQISFNQKRISAIKIKLNKSQSEREEISGLGEATVVNLMKESGFSNPEQIGDFSYQLTNIEGLLQSLMNVIKDSRNVTKILKSKIEDLCEMIQPRRQKVLHGGIDTTQLVIGLKIKYPYLNTEGRLIKVLLLEVLEKSDKKDFYQNNHYYEAILTNVNLMQLAKANEREISSIAKKLAKELIVKGKKEKKSDSSSNSNSDSNSDSDTGKESEEEEEEEEDVVAFFIGLQINKGHLPQSILEIKSEKKEAKATKKQLKKNLKSEKKSKKSKKKSKKTKKKGSDSENEKQDSFDESTKAKQPQSEEQKKLSEERSNQLHEIKSYLKFLDGLLDSEIFLKHIKASLKNINEIIQDVYGKEIKKEFKFDFEITFSSFGTDVVHYLNGIKDSNQLLKLESLPELEAVIKANKFAKQIEGGSKPSLGGAPSERLALEM